MEISTLTTVLELVAALIGLATSIIALGLILRRKKLGKRTRPGTVEQK